MNKFAVLITASVLFTACFTGCGKEKESPMVDMDTIQNDGSHDDKYIFRKEIEKEESRGKKYKKDQH